MESYCCRDVTPIDVRLLTIDRQATVLPQLAKRLFLLRRVWELVTEGGPESTSPRQSVIRSQSAAAATRAAAAATPASTFTSARSRTTHFPATITERTWLRSIPNKR